MNLNITIHKFSGKYLYEIVAFNNYEHIAQSMHLLDRLSPSFIDEVTYLVLRFIPKVGL